MQEPKNKPQKPFLYDYSQYIGVGFQMVVLVLLGLYGGQYLDRKFEKENIFTIVCILIAIFVSLFVLVKTLMKGKGGRDNQEK